MKHYVVIAGLSARYHDELRQKLGGIERRYRNIVFVSAPLSLKQPERYDVGYAKSLEARVVRALESDKDDTGLLFVYLNRDDQAHALFRTFFHIGIVAPITMPEHDAQAYQEIAQTVNSWVENISAIYERFRKNIPAVREEVLNKRNKTPLLLPLRNFRSQILNELVTNVSSQIINADDEDAARDYVSAQISTFNVHHPVRQIEDTSIKAYFNEDGTVFKAPGKSLHAIQSGDDENHLSSCKLESRLRVGHSFHPAFHYDCTFRKKAVREIPSCHGAFTRPGKTDHANIAPSDFVRKAG